MELIPWTSLHRSTHLIVVENGIEAGTVSVEEILVAQPVIVSVSFLRVAQKRFRKPVERRHPSLEPQSTDVDDHAVGDVKRFDRWQHRFRLATRRSAAMFPDRFDIVSVAPERI